MGDLNVIHANIAAEPLGLTERHTAIRQAPGKIDAKVLAANVAEIITPPAAATYVIFSATASFWARPDATAAVQAADVTDGTGSELNPLAWELRNVTTISVIAETACKISLSFYKRV